MELQEIKARLRMRWLLEQHYQLSISPNKHLHCPFHDDKTPSMKLYEESDTVYCFSGNCDCGGKSMDVIDVVMHMEQCSKHEAIIKCKELLGWVKEEGKTKQQPNILPQIWADLQQLAKRSPKAKAYVKSRGLEGIEVGYNNGRWHLQPQRTQAEKDQAFAVNFLMPPFTKEHNYGIWARNTLMFGLKNRAGEVVSLYGRAVEGKGHFYMKGGTRGGLYPGYPSNETRRVILTESIIDAASLLQIPELVARYEVLALYGTNGFNADHRHALSALAELEEVILMLDGDEAGHKASQTIANQLMQLIPQASIRIAELPEGMDVNELWTNHLSPELFIELLQTATTHHQSTQSRPLAARIGPEQTRLLSSTEAEKQPKHLTKDVKPNLDLEIIRDNYYTYEYEEIQFFVLGGIDLGGIKDMRCTLKVKLIEGTAREQLRHSLNLFHHGQVKRLEKHMHEQLGISHLAAKDALSRLIEQLELYREQWQNQQHQALPKRTVKTRGYK